MLTENKKDDIYFKGPFWIIADSFTDIIHNKFEIVGKKIPCYYDGTEVLNDITRKEQTHKQLWKTIGKKYPDKDYTYYPRGRVGIYEANGIAYIWRNER